MILALFFLLGLTATTTTTLATPIAVAGEATNPSKPISIGVVGYSHEYFVRAKARDELVCILKEILQTQAHGHKDRIELVSGTTDLGVPGVAYHVAEEMGLHTVGISCPLAYSKEYKTYVCNEEYTEGEKWGDESETFLKRITHLVKIGGGVQSKDELNKFKAELARNGEEATGRVWDVELEKFGDPGKQQTEQQEQIQKKATEAYRKQRKTC